ncbi:MAG: Uma2 family endonuclease [Myxococcota bacterium]|nr:Uma2 family endonuclease [Myxococcota bacterium]
MTARMTDAPVPLEDYVPTADQFVVLRGEWATYQALLAARGDGRSPRIAYLDGVLQLMSPSRTHESITCVIGLLIAEYCLARGLPFSANGAWTQKAELEEAGLEPDACFVFGQLPLQKDRPDLAIEVVWTSGGINKLEIYRRFGIAEVWFWENDRITVHVLDGAHYVEVERSGCLPTIDIAVIARLSVVEPHSAAILELREILRQGNDGT